MNIFFDTEFTGLHKDTTLISIGLIAENNRQFYAEFLDYNVDQCDEWIINNVLKNRILPHQTSNGEQNYYFASRDENVLKGNFYDDYSIEMVGNKSEIAKELKRWLSQFHEVQFISDVCHYDFVLLIDLLGKTAFDIPQNCNAACHDINQDIANMMNITEKEAFDVSRESLVPEEFISDIVSDGQSKHNALYDAQIIKQIHKVIEESK